MTLENLTRKEDEVNAFISSVVRYLPATDDRLQELRSQLQQDEVTRQIMIYCGEGWPEKAKLKSALKPYWTVQGELTVVQELLMKGVRPVSMRLEILDKLHEGHQEVTQCRSWRSLLPIVPHVRENAQTQLNCASHHPTVRGRKSQLNLFEINGHCYLLQIP